MKGVLASHGITNIEVSAPQKPVEGALITRPFEIIDLTEDDDEVVSSLSESPQAKDPPVIARLGPYQSLSMESA